MGMTVIHPSNETRVNTTTASDQYFPSVASIDGGYVVTWESYYQDGSGSGIYAQRYDSSGAAQGSETRVNTTTANDQSYPSVASIDGGYVVTWVSYYQDGSDSGIYAQRYDSSGAAQGGETRVNTTTANDQYYPSVASIDGGYVVTWMSNAQDGSGWGIYAQRYDSSGAAQGGETLVNTTTADNQYYPSVASIDGGYVVAWYGNGLNGWGIQAQRFDSDGVPQGSETLVGNNPYYADAMHVVGLPGGGYAVAWSSYDSSGSGISLRVVVPADIHTLTSGADTVAGTSDPTRVITAPDDLGPGDTLAGGLGADTIELNASGTPDLTAPAALSGFETIEGASGNDTFIVSNARLADITTIDGREGNDTVQTADATLDLSGKTLINIEKITTTNTAGTAFTVDNATQALLIEGAGQADSVTWADGTFSAYELSQLRGHGIETISDASGTYTTIGGAVANQPVNDNATIAPFAALTVVDPDDHVLTVTVTIVNGASRGDFTSATTAEWTRGQTWNGDIVYTQTFGAGPNNAAVVEAAVRALVFDPRENALPSGQTETTYFTVSVSDGTDTVSNNTTSTITSPVNDAPVASPVTLAASAEDSVRIITAAELLAGVSDVDGPTATITSLSIASGNGTLTQVNATTWSYVPATNDDTSVTFSYTASDGSLTATSTATLDITPVNDAPTVTGTDTVVSYTERADAEILAPDLVLVDSDSTISSATVRVANGGAEGDVLNFTAAHGITGYFNPNNFTLTLSGTATADEYQEVLRSVTFANPTNNDPTLNDEDRQIEWTVTDSGSLTSVVAQTTVTIVPISAPGVTGADFAEATEDKPLVVDAAHGVLANDSDPDGGLEVITRQVGTEQGGTIVFSPDGSYLYTPSAGFNGVDSVDYTVRDGNREEMTNTLTINVSATADQPTIVLANSNLAGVRPAGDAASVDVLGEDVSFNLTAALSGGGHVLVWSAWDEERAVYAQVFKADGTADGAPSQVTPHDGSFPLSVMPRSDGGFSITWIEASDAYVEKMQLFDSDGIPQGDTIALGNGTMVPVALSNGNILTDIWSNDERFLQIFDLEGHAVGAPVPFERGTVNADANGGFVVLRQLSDDLGHSTLEVRHYDALGAFDGAPVIVRETDDARISASSITSLPDGRSVAVWVEFGNSYSGGTSPYEIHARVLDSTGLYSETIISVEGVGSLYGAYLRPAITVLDTGYVLSWTESDEFEVHAYANNDDHIPTAADPFPTRFVGYVQVFDFDGVAVSEPTLVQTGPGQTAFGTVRAYLQTVALADGNFAVLSLATDNLNTDIHATVQVFDLFGHRVGNELRVGGDDLERNPSIAALPDGGFAVSWGELSSAGESLGLRTQRFDVQSVAVGTEDTAVLIPMSVRLYDTDGSEIIDRILVTGVPDGWTLAAPSGATATHDGAQWIVQGASLTGTLDFKLTPAPNANGSVTLLFRAVSHETSNGDEASHTASITIDFASVNDAPVATPVTLTASSEDTTRTITAAELLAGVSDVDGPSATITSLSIASGNGTLTQVDATTWSYVPATNDDTSVTFSYTASDGSLTASSTATLDLMPVNDAPVASPVTLAASAEDSVRIITAAELLAGVTDVDGPAATVTSLSLTSGNGTLTRVDASHWSYMPAANDDTSATFSYTVSDGSLSATSTATLDLTPVNDAPVTSPVALAASAEDTTRIITAAELLAGVSDVDGPAATVTSLSLTSGNGTLTRVDATHWSYVPAANDDTAATFSYTVSDGSLSATSTATLDLTPVNDAPVASPVTLSASAEDTTRIIAAAELLAGVSDVDGPAATITDLSLTSGNGTLTRVDATHWSYVPAANDDTSATFSYTVSDGSLSASSTATLDLTPVNNAPVARNDTVSTVEARQLTIAAATLLANDSDADPGDTLTLVSVDGSRSAGTVQLSGGTVLYTPASSSSALRSGETATDSFVYTVQDSAGATSTASVTVTITGTDSVPVITGFSPDTGVRGDGMTTSHDLVLNGTADANTQVSILDRGQAVGFARTGSDGAWSYQTGTVASGDHLFTAQTAAGVSAALAVHVTSDAVNHAPSVSAQYTTLAGISVAASSLFAATDPDGNPIVKYELWDSTSDSISGYWSVNGVVQGANQTIAVSAEQLALTTFQVGKGLDTLWVRASDGEAWSAWVSFTVLEPPAGASPTTAPTVSVMDCTATRGQTLAVADLFSASGADGEPITKIQLWDGTADVASGVFSINGIAQPAGTALEVNVADLACASFRAGTGTDTVWVRAYDGSLWSDWKSFTVTGSPNHAPAVQASSQTVSKGATLAASALFTASDGDGDAMVQYQLWDTTATAGSGYWVVNGISQGAGHAIDVSANDLAAAHFQAGTGTDNLWVRAFDGISWGEWTGFSVAGQNHAPVIAAHDMATSGLVEVPTLFSATDADGDAIVRYELWDSTVSAHGGYFLLNGVVQGDNQAISVDANQLGSAKYLIGESQQMLWVRAFDGSVWSDWKSIDVTGPDIMSPDNSYVRPGVAVHHIEATHGQSVAAEDLFVGSFGPHENLVSVQFWDSTAADSSGHFVFNGQASPSGAAIEVQADELGHMRFQSGSGTDQLWARVYDGWSWSDWQSFTVTAPTNAAPIVTAPNLSLATGQVVQASTLFSVVDSENDSIAKYQFWDSTATSSSGHFVVNGQVQGANQNIDVLAADLDDASFVAGPLAGSDTLWVRAFDGMDWSEWKQFSATTQIAA